MDAHEAYWAEQSSAVVFIMGLQDLNQPYSCEQWGNQGVSGAPVIVEHDGHLFDLFHDSWNAFPTYVLIDHTMTVRAKPWTYNSNSNTNSCDGSNSSVNGWSGGDTDDFLQQLVDECGDLCIDGGCTTAAGDLNEDENLNIQGKKSITIPLGETKVSRKVKALTVIYRSCTNVNMLTQNKKRLFDKEKSEYTFRSLNSIISSLEQARISFPQIEIDIVIIDYNSKKIHLDHMKKQLNKSRFNNSIISLFAWIEEIFL